MTTQDVLQCFIYILIRDYVQPGDIGTIMQDINIALNVDEIKEFCYTNKHLAAYAKEIVERLSNYEKLEIKND